MARNQEKAATLLNRWTTFKSELRTGKIGGRNQERPRLSTDCKSLPEAENVRRELLDKISEKITLVQNASLGEHRIRELNDEINKLIRTKSHWERQILVLGGRDYSADANVRRQQEHDGKEIPGSKGYLYFGAAKELPGVRDLFTSDNTSANDNRRIIKRKRADLEKSLDLEYYGLLPDSDDKEFQEAQRMLMKHAQPDWIKSSKEIEEMVAKEKKVQGDFDPSTFLADFSSHLGNKPSKKESEASNDDNNNDDERAKLQKRKQNLLELLQRSLG